MKTDRSNYKNLNTSFYRLIQVNLDEQVDFIQQKEELADAILNNCPVYVNFNKVKSTRMCNIVLSFLQGVVYAIEGDVIQIGDESFLFGSKDAFADGSLDKWVKNNGRI